MKISNLIFLIIIFFLTPANKTPTQEDLNELITDISNNYIYQKDKAVDLTNTKEKYVPRNYAVQTQLDSDEVLNYGLMLLNNKTTLK